MESVVELVRDLLIFVVAMFGLLIALLVIVSKMPDDNPLKRILSALSYRVGATVAAGMIAIPIEPIPGLDTLYDFAVPIALIWYWFTFLGRGFVRCLIVRRLPRTVRNKSGMTADEAPPGETSARARKVISVGLGTMLRTVTLDRHDPAIEGPTKGVSDEILLDSRAFGDGDVRACSCNARCRARDDHGRAERHSAGNG
jgi:hypothetical protein